MKRLNIPSATVLIPREKRIKAIQELYEQSNKAGIEVTQLTATVTENTESISEIKGIPTDTPVEFISDDELLPENGKVYALGDRGTMWSVSMETPAMTQGCTVFFHATGNYPIILPTEYEDGGDIIKPVVRSQVVAGSTFECTSGKDYILMISAFYMGINEEDDTPLYVNVYDLLELEGAPDNAAAII